MPEQEYLVFYEDEGPGDEELVLDIHTVRSAFASSLDIEADIGLNVNNVAGRTGRIGITLATIGFLAGLGAAILFGRNYPEDWAVDGATSAQIFTNLLAIVSLLGLVIGTALTVVGRTIQAQGMLHGIHLVQRNPGKARPPQTTEVDPFPGQEPEAAPFAGSDDDPDDWAVDDDADAEDDEWDFGDTADASDGDAVEESDDADLFRGEAADDDAAATDADDTDDADPFAGADDSDAGDDVFADDEGDDPFADDDSGDPFADDDEA